MPITVFESLPSAKRINEPTGSDIISIRLKHPESDSTDDIATSSLGTNKRQVVTNPDETGKTMDNTTYEK